MSARKAGGNAAAGALAPLLRAAALTASSCTWRSMTSTAPHGQASACKPNQLPPASRQGFKATAPQGLEPRPAGAESVPIEDAPSVRSTDPGIPPDLLNPTKGLSMAKTARASLQVALKFVPVPDLMKADQKQQTMACRPSNRRFYTLCEVDQTDRQFVPPSDRPVCVPENPSDFGTTDRVIFCSMSGRPISSTASNTSPFIPILGIWDSFSQSKTPRQLWAAASKHPANPLNLVLAQRTGGAA